LKTSQSNSELDQYCCRSRRYIGQTWSHVEEGSMPRHLLARLDWRALACGLPFEPQTEQLAPTQAALSPKQQDQISRA